MIDIDNLDKNKTYSGVVFKKKAKLFSASWWIQRKGKQTADLLGMNLDYDEIPIHSFMLFHAGLLGWYIYESHWKKGGTYMLTLNEWLSRLSPNEVVEVFEDNLSIETANKLLGSPYGKTDIKAFSVEYIFRFFNENFVSKIHKKDTGLFCTEYVATCQEGEETMELYFSIQKHLMEPIHHWVWGTKK